MAPNIVDKEINFPIPIENVVPKARRPIIASTSCELESNEKQTRFLSLQGDIKWMNFIMMVIFHGIAVYGLINLPYIERWKTTIWSKLSIFIFFLSNSYFNVEMMKPISSYYFYLLQCIWSYCGCASSLESQSL